MSNNWGYRKCYDECSLGDNLVIDNFVHVASDNFTSVSNIKAI